MQTIGIIVAGGKSRRMGRDKALLQHNGKSLLDHALDLLDFYGVDEKLVMGRPDHPNGLADPKPGAGPAANLSSWITCQGTSMQLIVLPVDMPLLTIEHLTYLKKNGGYFEGLYLPFFATISSPFSVLSSRVQDLVNTLGLSACDYPPEWGKQLINVNTPQDLEILVPPKKI